VSLKLPRLRVTPARIAEVSTRPAVLAFIWLATILQVLTIVVQLPGRATRWDFSIYYMSATALREGLNPYKTDFNALGARLGLDAGPLRHATDPPTFLILISPLARVRERVSYYLWLGLNTVLLTVALVLLIGRSSGLSGGVRLTIVALALLYPPLGWHYLYAQSKIPILLLLILMMRCIEKGWNRAAGCFLAFAGLLRIFPLLLVGYLVLQRRWRVLTWTFIGLAVGSLLTVALLGTGNAVSSVSGVAFNLGRYQLSRHMNIALAAFVTRVFWFIMGQQLTSTLDSIRRLTIVAADAALLGTTIWATLKLKPCDDPDWRGLSLWIVASVLLSPTAWPHYMVLFLIVFSQIICASIHWRADVRTQWLALLSYSLTILTLMFMPPPNAVISYLGYHRAYRLYEMALELYGVSTVVLFFATLSFTLNAISFETSKAEAVYASVPGIEPFSRQATAG
jgi:hypothetical protein